MKHGYGRNIYLWVALLVCLQVTPSYGFIFRFLFGRRFNNARNFRPANNNFVQPSFDNNNFNGGVNKGFVGNNQLNNNQIGQSGLEEIAGFSNLLKNGNALIERNTRGEVRRLFIDGAGNLLGATEAETVRQAREFFTLNRDKFNANQRNVVDRFLLRNGGASDGRFTIDLKNIGMFQEIPENQRIDAALATLNFFLNTIQTNVRLRIPRSAVKPDGTVDLDLSRFLRGEALSILKQSDTTSACTGKTRLDRMINAAMVPATYYRLINAPQTLAELAEATGIQDDKTRTSRNKIIVGIGPNGKPESGPTKNVRVIEFQASRRVPGSTCYRSLDVNETNASGSQAESRDVRLKGINFTHEAEEWLCLGRNGMMQGFLVDATKKTLIGEAPASIATGGINGPKIQAVHSCLDCHAGGFLAGDKQYSETALSPDIANVDTVFREPFGNRLRHQDFFTTNAQYRARAVRDSNIFLEAQKATGSFFSLDGKEPLALIPRIIKKFNEPLTPADAARSLGISEGEAKGLLGNKNMDRTSFESQFCNLRRGSTLPIDESVDRDLLRREIRDGRGFGSFPAHR